MSLCRISNTTRVIYSSKFIPTVTSVRNYAKPNIKHPQYPHKQRALFLELTRVELPPSPDDHLCYLERKAREEKKEVNIIYLNSHLIADFISFVQ